MSDAPSSASATMSDSIEELAERSCAPCRGGMPALAPQALAELHARLGSGWQLVGDHHLYREFRFPDFRTALAFVNRVGEIAEAENHHPDLTLAWGKVGVSVFTHKVGGLTENDFVLAAKAEKAFQDAL